MYRLLFIILVSFSFSFSQSKTLTKDKISVIKKQARADAMGDFKLKNRLGWATLGTLPMMYDYFIPFRRNSYFKTMGILMFGTPLSTLFFPVKNS